MTDKEMFTATYKQVGINLKFYDYEGWDVCTLSVGQTEEGVSSDKIQGYSGYVTHLYFDKSGKFIEQIIGE